MLFANRMKIFSVLLNPAESNPYEHARFIAEGFNLYAFIFTGFWALSQRMWWMALFFFILHLGSTAMGEYMGLSAQSIVILELGIRAMIGLSANDMFYYYLQRKGWLVSDVIVAYNELEASHRYYERHLGDVFSSGAAQLSKGIA